MITYNQYPQLGVRQRPLAMTCLSWRDFLRKQDLLHPVSTGSSWCHYRHLGPPLMSCPPTLDSFCFSSSSTLISPEFLILFYLKRSGPLSGHLDQFSQFIKRDQVFRLDDVSLHDGFVRSLKNISIHPRDFVKLLFKESLNSCHTQVCFFQME